MESFEHLNFFFKIFIVLLIFMLVFILGNLLHQNFFSKNEPPFVPALITLSNPFIYKFNTDGVLYESNPATKSSSPYWWLNSGGKLILEEQTGHTIQGDLPLLDKWHVLYALANPTDTDNGSHPQNLFRLLTQDVGLNVSTESLFKIERNNFSSSSNRNASNGLLLMSRYIDGNTVYYAGIRVDGTAVIKKKYQGIYYTMAQKKIFSGTYNRAQNSNLLPQQQWLGLRTETVTATNGNVTVRLFMRDSIDAPWPLILEATDDGIKYGNTPPITAAGRSGIRTDFMDVTFESFRMGAL